MKYQNEKTITKIKLIGECNSSNLGDKLISECSRYIIKKINKKINVIPLDFSCRNNSIKNISLKSHSEFWFVKKVIPRKYKNFIFWLAKKRIEYNNFWNNYIFDGDLIIFGGGNLIQDNYLDFPLKLLSLFKILKIKKNKIFLFSLGVGETRSFISKRILRHILKNKKILGITTRDEYSKNNLKKYLKYDDIKIIPDPALWASEMYSITKSLDSKYIGLNIISSNTLRRHSNILKKKGRDFFKIFYSKLIYELNKKDFMLTLFTNGANEDNKYAHELYQNVEKCNTLLIPKNTKELVRNISKNKIILGFRLHSIIVSYSLDIPFIAFSWDDKVKAFTKEIDKNNRCIDINNISMYELIKKITKLYDNDESNVENLNKMKRNTYKEIEQLLKKEVNFE
jgi:polysaccharide pyruvyl transferase WcaK-like protein